MTYGKENDVVRDEEEMEYCQDTTPANQPRPFSLEGEILDSCLR